MKHGSFVEKLCAIYGTPSFVTKFRSDFIHYLLVMQMIDKFCKWNETVRLGCAVGLTKLGEVRYDLEFIFGCVTVSKICLVKPHSC